MYAMAKVNKKIRYDLFDSLVHQEIGFFDVTKTGTSVFRLFLVPVLPVSEVVVPCMLVRG